MRTESSLVPYRSTGLVDVLDRVLDKGLVVAGDVKISLAEVELLTIRIRLIVCSIDKAEQIGLDWWKSDRYFARTPAPARDGTPGARRAASARQIVSEVSAPASAVPRGPRPRTARRRRPPATNRS